MYEVVVETGFSAVHEHGDGVHGHDFKVYIAAAAAELKDDVVVDFHDLKQRADKALARLAYTTLGQNPALQNHGSGPAAIARWLHEELEKALPEIAGAADRRIARVEVWDTPRSGASYTEQG